MNVGLWTLMSGKILELVTMATVAMVTKILPQSLIMATFGMEVAYG